MRNILGLLLILIIGFTSCEGRKTQSQAFAESVEEYSNTTTIQKIVYNPENYTEVITDTILSDGFRVKVKYYSDMNNQILDEVIQEDIIYKKYHREFNAHLTVFRNDREIFNKIIDKTFFKKLKNIIPDSLDYTIISNIVVNNAIFIDDKDLNVEIWLNKINTNVHQIFTLVFNENGIYRVDDVKEIEF